jgi:hypothetical protein
MIKGHGLADLCSCLSLHIQAGCMSTSAQTSQLQMNHVTGTTVMKQFHFPPAAMAATSDAKSALSLSLSIPSPT